MQVKGKVEFFPNRIAVSFEGTEPWLTELRFVPEGWRPPDDRLWCHLATRGSDTDHIYRQAEERAKDQNWPPTEGPTPERNWFVAMVIT